MITFTSNLYKLHQQKQTHKVDYRTLVEVYTYFDQCILFIYIPIIYMFRY